MKKGEIIKLGKHTLMCGDATNLDDIKALMGDNKAHMVFTDPPWGVAYTGRTKVRKGIANDNLKSNEFECFLSKVFENVSKVCEAGAMVYVVFGAAKWEEMQRAMRGSGYKFSKMLIWEKDTFVVSWADYHSQYEPIWYGWTAGKKRLHPVTDRSQSDIWKCKRPKRSDLHPTTKPVDLIKRAILNSTNEGDIVIDMFGGSGSTLIACEETNRTCFILEIDGSYCDSIVERYYSSIGIDSIKLIW